GQPLSRPFRLDNRPCTMGPVGRQETAMAEYELIFETAAIAPEQEDAVYEAFDAVISVHDDTTLVTVTAVGESASEAAHRAAAELRSKGVRPIRLYEDLVTRR